MGVAQPKTGSLPATPIMFLYSLVLAFCAVNSFSDAARPEVRPLKNCTGHNCSTFYSTTLTSKPVTRGTATPSVNANAASTFNKTTTSPCNSDPCLSGGTCDVIGNGYICACPVGYDPKDNCHPCLHGWFGKNCLQQCGACARPVEKVMKKNPNTDQLLDFFRSDGGGFDSTAVAASFALFCDRKKGCTKCSEDFYPTPVCDRIKCNLANPQASDNKCHPGKCVRDKCLCPAGIGGATCNKKRLFKDDEKCESLQEEPQAPRFGFSFGAASTPTCSGGGTCYVQDGQQLCLCPPGMLTMTRLSGCVEKCVSRYITCLHGVCQEEGAAGGCKCNPGYTGAQCDKKCPVDRYGKNCAERCGFCEILPCDETDGYCPGWTCLPGFKGKLCRDRSEDSHGPVILARGNMEYDGKFRATFNLPNSGDKIAIVNATEKLLAMGCQIITGFKPDYVVITAVYPGSVGVSYVMSLNPQNVSGTANVRRALTKALRQAAKDVPPPLPGYSLNINSIKVSDVEKPGADDGRVEETGTVAVDSSVLITAAVFMGIMIICIPMVVCLFVRQKRKGQPRKRERVHGGYIRNTSWYQRRTSSRPMRSA